MAENGELYRNTLRDALNRYVGRGCLHSTDDFSHMTGIDLRRLSAFKQGEFAPRFDELMRMVATLPTSFAREILGPAGVTAVSKGGHAPDRPEVLNSKLCHSAAQLAQALEDGKLDHQERAAFLPVAERLRDDLEAFISGNVTPLRAGGGQ